MELIPLLGGQFLPAFTPTNVNLEFLAALDEFSSSEVKTIDSLLEESGYPVLIKKKGTSKQELRRGATIAGSLAIGEVYNTTLFLPLTSKSSSSPSKPPGGGSRSMVRSSGNNPPNSSNQESPITIADNGIWLEIKKGFGPVYFNKVGLQYRRGEIHFAPEIALVFRTFSFFLNEISVSSSLVDFDPGFNLDGFELEYKQGTIEIGGAFLRSEEADYDEYAGMGVLKLSLGRKSFLNLGLSAIGAYADTDKASFFLYAVLDFPIGGPPFLFFTGVVAGFGYNRSLTVPPIEDIHEFPLVAQAIEGKADFNTNNIGEEVNSQLEGLQDYIAVQVGAGFLAIGIKFTSFKLLDCFALVTAAIDNSFELNILGSACLMVPPFAKKAAIVYMEMLLKTTFSTKEGVFSLEAQVAEGSYILSKSCHITGGYAFYLWFDGPHAGDFVISMGGYHPEYEVPDHYPPVPRLGCNWKLGPIAFIGEMYFTLCAHAVMAGGGMEANFKLGAAYAGFYFYANFLICWKPYHYDVGFGIGVKAGFGALGPLRLGVDLHIWGPDFGGYGKVHCFLFSFKIKFGDQSSQYPQAIDWAEFKESFLPEGEDVCNLSVSQGLVKQIKNDSEDILIVNPKEFEVITNSMVPVKTATQGESGDAIDTKDANTVFGIRPMAVKGSDLTSTHKVKITLSNGGSQDDVTADLFAFEPVTKEVPSSLWSQPDDYEAQKKVVKTPSVNAPQFVENSLCGFRVIPAKQPPTGNTENIDAAILQYDVNPIPSAYAWNNIVPFAGTSTEEGRETIKNSVVNNDTRDSLLTALGFDPSADMEIDESVADDFVIVPQVG